MAFWCAAQVHCQHERLALHCLSLAKFETYVPRILERRVLCGRKIDVPRPLFPSYIFIWIVDHWWTASRTPGVVRLVMDGERPAKVPNGVIDEIKARERDGFVLLPRPRGLVHGDRVHIRQGVFQGKLAIYQGQAARDRVAVLLAFLGGARRVILPRDSVEGVKA